MDTDEIGQAIARALEAILSALSFAWEASRPHLHDAAQWLADLLG